MADGAIFLLASVYVVLVVLLARRDAEITRLKGSNARLRARWDRYRYRVWSGQQPLPYWPNMDGALVNIDAAMDPPVDRVGIRLMRVGPSDVHEWLDGQWVRVNPRWPHEPYDHEQEQTP